MGRLIDTSELAKRIALQKKRFGNLLEVPICNVFADMIRDTPTAKAIPKDQYEARLKADMVSVLEDLKEQLREMHEDYFETEHFDEAYGASVLMDEIQQKINSLKEKE